MEIEHVALTEDDLDAEWLDMVLADPDSSFFRSPVWARSWLDAFAPDAESIVLRARDGRRGIGLLPLTCLRERLHRRLPGSVAVVRLAGSGLGAADHLGPVLAGGAQQGSVADALWHAAVAWAGDRSIELDAVGPDVTSSRGRARVVDEQRVPVASITDGTTWDDVEAGWTKNRRRSLRKKLRKLADAGGSFEWIDEPTVVAQRLPDVVHLHELRRTELGEGSRFIPTTAHEALHQNLVRNARDRCHPWIQVARLDGRAIGALYGFRLADRYHVYQSGWDPAFAHLSVGLIQYAAAYRHVVETGGRVFDMCRGTDPYKLRFATRIDTQQTLLLPRGVPGRLLEARWALRRRRRPSRADEPTDTSED